MNIRLIIALMLAWVVVPATQAQVQTTSELVGSWTGKINVMGTQLTLVLHLKQVDGNVVVSLDSPDQSAKGIPCYKDFLSDDSVALKVEMINAVYHARLVDGKLNGIFTQRSMSFPLVLSRGVEQLPRPQTPVPPYPYNTQEVTFSNAPDGATLAGTLTLPQGFDTMKKGSAPVLLMVTGSGQQNRDEEIFDHKPFLVIADHLARHGIATLRYDDRATGESVGGEVKQATTQDFMCDAAAALQYLRSLNIFGKVGCMGHSEGATIAFMLAARQEADFIISLAGPGVKGDTLLAAQANRIMQLSGMPASTTVAALRQQQAVQQVPWMKWFIDYDPSDDIRQTHCPVFALNGDNDSQVISAQNLTAIRRLLPPSSMNLVKEYPSLNHLFQHSTTGLPTEYRQIEETISPEVLNDIAAWVSTVCK